MRYIVTKETTVEQFDAMLEQLSKEKWSDILLENKKTVDLSQFCGILKLEEDPLAYQNRIRDEWER